VVYDGVGATTARGELTVPSIHRLPFGSVADAFAALEGRRTTGKVLLVR
jgi:hypothetical protein